MQLRQPDGAFAEYAFNRLHQNGGQPAESINSAGAFSKLDGIVARLLTLV